MYNNNIDIERAVLGAFLLEQNAFLEHNQLIKPEYFYDDSHKLICQAIFDLANENKPIDILTVTEKLKAKKQIEAAGGAHYVVGLTSQVGSASHVDFHCAIITQNYLKRELEKKTIELSTKAADPSVDVQDLLEEAEKAIFDLSKGNDSNDPVKITDILLDVDIQVRDAKESKGTFAVYSGFYDLDAITGGWQKKNLVIMAARPSMGKTACALSMAEKIALKYNKGVAIFSLEMGKEELVKRFISSHAQIPSEKLRDGNLDKYEQSRFDDAMVAFNGANIHIDDTSGLTVFELKSKLRRLAKKEQIDIVIVDYLQLMKDNTVKNGNREQEISRISQGLKAIAKELDLPVIALSQLNRSVESRAGDKRPMLSDLRESGAIEQDADIVIFIHRPEKFGIMEDEEGNSTKGLGQLIVAKHRNGALGDVNLRFRAQFAQFDNLEEKESIANFDPETEKENGVALVSSLYGLPNDFELEFDKEPPF